MEEGLDVLQIMRNIHIFVASFRYNLNSQVRATLCSPSRPGRHFHTVGHDFHTVSFHTGTPTATPGRSLLPFTHP